jgi:hypothetical protein
VQGKDMLSATWSNKLETDVNSENYGIWITEEFKDVT